MSSKSIVTSKILEDIAAAFRKALEQKIEEALEGNREDLLRDGYSIAAFDGFDTRVSRFFRQELGIEERDSNDYRGNEPRPRTASALLKLLAGAKIGIDQSIGKSGAPLGGFIGDYAIEYAVRTAREEAARQIEQAMTGPKKRPFRSPDEIAGRKADAFAIRGTKRNFGKQGDDTSKRRR